MTKMKFQIPYALLQEMDSQFRGIAKELCGQIAYTLNLPKDEVIQRVLTDLPKMDLEVYHTRDYQTSCAVRIKAESSIHDYILCRSPCVLNTGRCIHHQDVEIVPEDDPEEGLGLTRIASHESIEEPLWCDEETGTVYNSKKEVVGRLEDGRLILKKKFTTLVSSSDSSDESS